MNELGDTRKVFLVALGEIRYIQCGRATGARGRSPRGLLLPAGGEASAPLIMENFRERERFGEAGDRGERRE